MLKKSTGQNRKITLPNKSEFAIKKYMFYYKYEPLQNVI